jgi:negative regulator of replication initiation
MPEKYGNSQFPVGNGWYVITHSDTKNKKKMLEKIAKSLHINLKVEIID